jgi:hypothetical protein
MFVECGPGRLAALLGCRKNAWIPSGFFLISDVSRPYSVHCLHVRFFLINPVVITQFGQTDFLQVSHVIAWS